MSIILPTQSLNRIRIGRRIALAAVTLVREVLSLSCSNRAGSASGRNDRCNELRVLVVDARRNGGADPQHQAIECAVEQPGDADHGSDGENEEIVAEKFRDEKDRHER